MRKIAYLALAVSILSSAVILMTRHRAEQKLKQVELAVDLKETKELAFLSGKTLSFVLRRFKKEGISGAGAAEVTLSELVDEGRIVEIQKDGALRFKISGRQAQKIKKFLWLKMGSIPVKEKPGGEMVFFVSSKKSLMNLPLGISPDTMEALNDAGFKVLPRYENFANLKADTLHKILVETVHQKGTTFVFNGEEVLGFKTLIKEVGAQLAQNEIRFGFVEFGKQKGDAALARFAKPYVVRVHSIQKDELKNLTAEEAAERFVRAVKERGVRLLYIRPYLMTGAGVDAVEFNAQYIGKIRAGLERAGYSAASTASVLPDIQFSKVLKALVLAGIFAGVFLFFTFFIPESSRPRAAMLLFVFYVFCVSAWMRSPALSEKMFSLLSAVVFPCLAFLYTGRHAQYAKHAPSAARLSVSLVLFLKASLLTLCGAFLCAAFFTKWETMLHVETFSGVKLAHAVPLLFVFSLFAFDLFRQKNEERMGYIFRVYENVKTFLSSPLKTGHAAFAVVLLIGMTMVILRTGNEPGFGVSPLEMKFRSVLEGILFARPRTKEFLIGHPALLIAFGLSQTKYARWALVFFVIGMLGQVSLLNSFCHIHTPIGFTLLRALHGLWLGVVLGALAHCIVLRVFSFPPFASFFPPPK